MSTGRDQASAADPVVLRKAQVSDADAVAQIWHTGWRDGHLGHVPPELVRYRDEAQFLSRARQRIPSTWVAEKHGRVVAFVVIRDDEVEQIYVDRDARGSGVAARLLRKAEGEIREAGHRRAWLAVATGNQRARSFYARQGWRDAGAFTYMAETAAGPFAVPTHRYEIDLSAS